MGSNKLKIDMYQMAKDFLDTYPIFIKENALQYLQKLDNEIIEFVEDYASRVTPNMMIISNASYKDLYDTMAEYVKFEIRNRINDIVDNLEEEEADLETIQYFTIQVEKDGD